MNSTSAPHNCVFTAESIASDLSAVKQMLNPGESVSVFIGNMFETCKDRYVEWYEFLDFLVVVQSLPHPLTRSSVQAAMASARAEGVTRPWSFDEDGVCSMPDVLTVAKHYFRHLDLNHDGLLDQKELYGFDV